MIVRIEQKEYSTKTLKLVRAIKGAGDRLMTGINNAGLRAGDAITSSSKLTGPKFKFKPKSSYQLNRETIALRDSARNSADKVTEAAKHPIRTAAPSILKAQETASRVIMNPGAAVDKGVEASLRNPIAVGGNVGSKVLMVTNPETAAVPIGAMAIGAEQAAKKAIPAYAKATEKAATGYRRSRLSGLVRSGTNAIYTQLGGVVV